MAKKCPKCPEGLPPWLATFADLMSLLMCFFVLLLSFAEINATRFKKMAESMKDAFGVQREVPVTEVVMGTSVIKQEFSPSVVSEPSPIDEVRQTTAEEMQQLAEPDKPREKEKDKEKDKEQEKEKDKEEDKKKDHDLQVDQEVMEAVAQKIAQEVKQQAEELQEALKEEIEQGTVSVESEEAKIIIRIQEKGSFPSGTAVLNPGFFDTLDRISEAVGNSSGKVVVAGHTDDVPITTARFRSNWELSSARAVTVVHSLLLNDKIDPKRVVVEGYADTQPLVPNDTTENRATNRRVELVLIRGEDIESGESLKTNNPAPAESGDKPAAEGGAAPPQ